MIASAAQLEELLPNLKKVERVAVDTEADSLHCYFEKLCLLQLSFDGRDYLVDPLANVDLAPLCAALAGKEIVLQGADFDLRLLRRALNFVPDKIFDTVIAARLLGYREFSLAALVERYFEIKLSKGSQKANWAQRPLPARMAEYAMNDTHYLLPLAEKLEQELIARGRLDWFRQSCARAIEQAGVQRARDANEAWRISGAGKLRGRAAAVLRELWRWRETEAQAADRPPFHILQNHLLIQAAEDFAAEKTPSFRHFSLRRASTFQQAAQRGLEMPEAEWPERPRRTSIRPTREMERLAEELKTRRDSVAKELDLDPAVIAPRATLEAIAANQNENDALLVPWQRELLSLI